MSFRDFLNERYNDQFEDLSEMANVTKMDSGLPFAVWIDFNGVRRKVRHNSPRIKIEIDNARIPYLIDNSNPDFLVNEQFKKKLLKHIPAKKLKLLNDWIFLNYDTLMQHWNGEISDKMALNALKSIETS